MNSRTNESSNHEEHITARKRPRKTRFLPKTTVDAILSATERNNVANGEQLRRWLSVAFNDAVARSQRKPLCQEDVDRLRNAYDRFQDVIASLQDRDFPPPMIPAIAGATDWEHWLSGMHFGFKRGRHDGHDWKLIAQLLAVYEAVAQKSASGANEDGPTLRFLRSSLHALSLAADMELKSSLRAPTADALRQKLPHLRKVWMPTAIGQLSQIFDALAGKK